MKRLSTNNRVRCFMQGEITKIGGTIKKTKVEFYVMSFNKKHIPLTVIFGKNGVCTAQWITGKCCKSLEINMLNV